MTQSYATGSIAGVDLESSGGDPCKAVILDGARLRTPYAINTRVSAAGSLYVQTMALASGIRFGLKLEFCPPEVLADIIDAINDALGSQSTFNVTLSDDIHDINVDAVPDGGEWLSYPEQRTNEDSVRDVVFRFLTA